MYYANGERVNIIDKNTKYVVANMLNINYLVMHNLYKTGNYKLYMYK